MKSSIIHNGEEYSLECLSTLEDIQALETDWVRLEQSCPEPYTYFQSFDWCLNWSRVYIGENEAKSKSPRIFVVRREGKAILIWPLMVSRGKLGVRILTSLSEPVGQYSHVIYDASMVCPDLTEKVWQQVKQSVDVDAVTLNRFSSDSLLAKSLGDQGIYEQSQLYSSVMDLDDFDTWDAYMASLTGKQRKDRKRRRKKLEKLGEIEYKIHFGGSDDYTSLVKQAVSWKLDWLRRTGRQESVLSSAFFRDFLANLNGDSTVQTASPQGALLGVLTLDGKPLAIEIGACLSGHYYSFLGAFDWDYRDYSVGKIQIEEHQKWAKTSGVKKFDFLGDPAEYKGSWATSQGALECRSFPNSAFGYLYCAVWKARLRPFIRTMYHRLGNEGRVKLLRYLGLRKTLA